MKTGLLLKLIFTVLLSSALLYLVKAGVADFLRLAPCAYLEAVRQKTATLDPVRLAAAKERLLLAQSWDDGNPVIPEYLGQIALMRTQLAGFSPRLQVIFLKEAIDDYQMAIRLRPDSAYLWAARMTTGSMLIATNARLERDDVLMARELAELKFALRRAGALGPWEPSVLQQMVRVGSLHYGELSLNEREMVDGAKTRAKQLGVVI